MKSESESESESASLSLCAMACDKMANRLKTRYPRTLQCLSPFPPSGRRQPREQQQQESSSSIQSATLISTVREGGQVQSCRLTFVTPALICLPCCVCIRVLRGVPPALPFLAPLTECLSCRTNAFFMPPKCGCGFLPGGKRRRGSRSRRRGSKGNLKPTWPTWRPISAAF